MANPEMDNYVTPAPVIKDSGQRRTFTGGAQRDRAKGKGRFDLICAWAMEKIAKHFEEGALKYEDRNWEKGMPLSCFVDSALRHIAKALQGRTDEPHWVAAAWNLLCLVGGIVRVRLGLWPAEFNDLPKSLPPEVQARLEAEEKAENDARVTAEVINSDAVQMPGPEGRSAPDFWRVEVDSRTYQIPTRISGTNVTIYADDIRRAAGLAGFVSLFQILPTESHDFNVQGNIAFSLGPHMRFYTSRNL